MKRFEKNLVLIGMPGCGKTTIGKILSSRLNMNFIDLDEYIEKSSSSTIPEIFKKGEEYFRDLESKAVEEVAKEKSSIISTGGGVVKRKSNMSILKENGIIVFIDRPLEDIINDINTETRPLLKNNEEEINRLFNERYDIYRKYCDFIVNNRDIDTVVNDIINLIGGLKLEKKLIKVKNITIGEGIPKVCVPIVGETEDELIHELDLIKNVDCDIVEWRVDFFKYVKNIDIVINTLHKIKNILENRPMIFTFRSIKEGGNVEVSTEFYENLNRIILGTGLLDIIDVELSNDENYIKEVINIAHENSTKVIISNHDFYKTPEREEILNRLCREQSLGADICKVAVMPKSRHDVLTLLEATCQMKEEYAKVPVVTMSMGGFGVVSRLCGEVFGSDITFGSVEKASAPGQIPADKLHEILEELHRNL